jgi:membrane associated rhomboid family serine protease
MLTAMEPTNRDALAMLEEVGGIQVAVRAGTPREYVPFVAWGLLLALWGPIRDLGDDSVLGGILLWVAPAVSAAILFDYLRQRRQVRVSPRTPSWLLLAFGAWVIAAIVVLPSLLDGTIGYAAALGGILAAAPLLLWGAWLRWNA